MMKQRIVNVRNDFLEQGKVNIALVIVLFAIGLVLLLQVKAIPSNLESVDVSSGRQYCSPEPITENSPRITLPAYVEDCSRDQDSDVCKSICILDGNQGRKCGTQGENVPHEYARIKSNVPILGRWFHGLSCSPQVEDAGGNIGDEECFVLAPDSKDVQHFRKYGNEITVDGKNFEIWYPNAEAENSIRGFIGSDGGKVRAGKYKFHEYGIVMLVHMREPRTYQSFLTGYRDFVDMNWKEKKDDGVIGGGYDRFWIVDVYKDVTKSGDRFEKKELPEDIIQCRDDPDIAIATPTPILTTPTPQISVPSQNITPEADVLQLQTFLFGSAKPGSFNAISWWTPECKPAIYLYPEEKMEVNVKVSPKGFFTYTDPLYPKEGWNTTAFPSGELLIDGKKYPYLYYESKIFDEMIQKPQKGFVVPYTQLSSLYQSILPRLGLNRKESDDFISYWDNTLPFSSYYFVGIMEEKAIDLIEPLQITPKPATIMRVRLYFEALSEYKKVEQPHIITPIRKGFSVVEWGGMVKLHKGQEFTCSQ